MADVLRILFQLRHTSCLEHDAAENGAPDIDRVQDLIQQIEVDFKDCGRLIRSFHKNNATGKVRPSQLG